MNESLIEEYKRQMLEMYGKRGKAVPTVADLADNTENGQLDNSSGGLVGIVTAVRGIYFVPRARVTVFTGDPQNMDIIDFDFTDENGRTKVFTLPTPSKALSIDSENTEIPYALYNMMVEADGYMTNIHLNIPVFPTVTSRQSSNLLLLETAGVDKGPRIFDEKQNYNL